MSNITCNKCDSHGCPLTIKHKCEYCDSIETKPFNLENVGSGDKWIIYLCKEHEKKMAIF